jgi:HEAT repeat protein
MDIERLLDIPAWEWPEDAGKMLLEVLRDEHVDASQRMLAAELSGDLVVVNDEIARELLSITLDNREPEQLRSRAVISLAPALEEAYVSEYDDPDEVPISEELFKGINEALHKLYFDTGAPEEVRRRVLEVSAHAPQDWHRKAVLDAYSSKNEKWRLTAVFCMRYIRGFDNQIIESLDSPDPDIHYEAVVAAGHRATLGSWPHIAKLLTSEKTDKDLLLVAIEAAPNIKPGEAAAILADLTDSADEDISEAAYEAMGMADNLSDDIDNEDGIFN